MKHLIVRSRNISCKPLKELIVPKTTIYRMGSVTPTEEITKKQDIIEINSRNSCVISGNKILMKEVFVKNNIPTADYLVFNNEDYDTYTDILKEKLKEWKNGIIAKRKNSSKGYGLSMIKTEEDVDSFRSIILDDFSNWIFERYYTYTKEYRIHVTKDGCFYASRKMLLNDGVDRWHRHANNSVFIMEDNELFDKPKNWEDIVGACVNALNAIGLDIACFDVKVQKNNVDNPAFILLESNSAPSLKEHGIELYKKELNKIIAFKNEI